jgi:hypothetical protein
MMEYVPKQHIKVLVLEGSLRLSRNGTFGDDLLLTPGKMVIMKPDAKRIPDPVNVDLAKLVKTSSLVTMGNNRNGNAAPLPSMPLIEGEIEKQALARNDGTIVDTNLVIHGRGTSVTVEPDRTLASIERQQPVVLAKNQPTPRLDHGSVPVAPTQSSPADKLVPSPTPEVLPSATPTESSSPAVASPTPESTASPTDSPVASPTASASPSGGDDDEEDQNVQYGTKDERVGDLSISEPIDLSANGGHGKVSVASTGTVAVSSTIKVSGTDSKSAGHISIDTTKRNGIAINITSSAQLLALLNAAAPAKDGSIQFVSAGGDVNVAGKLQADGGTIDIANNGTNGVVNLNNATLNASTIKVGAVGNNGTLNIGGGTISADTAIKLYAGGTNGSVNFIDNVTLSGNSAKTIAADAVTIFNGKVVTVQGNAPASVFANHPNYSGFGGNGSTTGTFAGQGATTQPLSALPPRP